MKKLFLPILSLAVLTVGCNTQTGPRQFSYAGPAQGSTYSVLVKTTEDPQLKAGIDSILLAMDQSMSLWVPSSLLSKINSGDTNVRIDRAFYDVLEVSQNAHLASKGLFDPTIGPLVAAWGFSYKKTSGMLDSAVVDSMLPYIGFGKIGFSRNRVHLPQGMKLDFNAVAQGYTVDQIAQWITSKGITDYMIEVGGEVIAHGTNDKGEAWKIGIDKPAHEIQAERFQAIVSLNNKALATSGNYRKYYVDEATGEKYAHTLLPTTGYPVRNNLLSVTIIADDCATADAMATASLVMGLDKAKAFLLDNPHLEGFLIFSDEQGEWQEWYTPGFEAMRKL
ncbi:MAG: FAD:protein FMN transferase [Schleiferiaceae bacterium]